MRISDWRSDVCSSDLIFKLWDGGMSLHGGVIGVLVAIWYVTKKEKLSFLRFCDYIACVVPFGLFFGRLSNFLNGALRSEGRRVGNECVSPRGSRWSPSR